MEEKLTQEVAQVIERILAGKDEAEQRRRTEDALTESASTIESLTSELEAANDKNEELSTQVSELEAAREAIEKNKTEAQVELEKSAEASVKEIEDLKTQLAEKTNELEDIKKDAVSASRMAELESAGVVRDNKEAQTAKVREMNDADFTTYKEELESVRAHIMAELKEKEAELSEEAKAAKAKEEAAAKAAADTLVTSDGDVLTAPAKVDPANLVSAALNLEIYPSEDMLSQYADFGKALAGAMTKDK